MGTAKVLNTLKKRAIFFVIFFGILGVPTLFLGVVGLVFVQDPFFFVFLLTGVLCAIIALLSVPTIKNPGNSRYVRKNGERLAQLDELYSNVIYQDKYIVYSDKYITGKDVFSKILRRDEVVRISESRFRINFITFSHMVSLATSKGVLSINVQGVRRENIDQMKYNIGMICPNCVEY